MKDPFSSFREVDVFNFLVETTVFHQDKYSQLSPVFLGLYRDETALDALIAASQPNVDTVVRNSAIYGLDLMGTARADDELISLMQLNGYAWPRNDFGGGSPPWVDPWDRFPVIRYLRARRGQLDLVPKLEEAKKSIRDPRLLDQIAIILDVTKPLRPTIQRTSQSDRPIPIEGGTYPNFDVPPIPAPQAREWLQERVFTERCESPDLHDREYGRFRDAITALGPEAIPFLSTLNSNDGWREKWIKGILLARIQRPQTYADLETTLGEQYNILMTDPGGNPGGVQAPYIILSNIPLLEYPFSKFAPQDTFNYLVEMSLWQGYPRGDIATVFLGLYTGLGLYDENSTLHILVADFQVQNDNRVQDAAAYALSLIKSDKADAELIDLIGDGQNNSMEFTIFQLFSQRKKDEALAKKLKEKRKLTANKYTSEAIAQTIAIIKNQPEPTNPDPKKPEMNFGF